MIVAAARRDGEYVLALPRQQDLIVTDVARQQAAVGKIGGGNAFGEVGTGRLRLIVGHLFLPLE
jgi:hypothetical protein